MRERLNFINRGDGYNILYCRDVKTDGYLTTVQVSTLGAEPFEVKEGEHWQEFGVGVSYEAFKEFYNKLKLHFEGSKDPLKEHHEDMRKMAFGLLDVLKK